MNSTEPPLPPSLRRRPPPTFFFLSSSRQINNRCLLRLPHQRKARHKDVLPAAGSASLCASPLISSCKLSLSAWLRVKTVGNSKKKKKITGHELIFLSVHSLIERSRHIVIRNQTVSFFFFFFFLPINGSKNLCHEEYSGILSVRRVSDGAEDDSPERHPRANRAPHVSPSFSSQIIEAPIRQQCVIA